MVAEHYVFFSLALLAFSPVAKTVEKISAAEIEPAERATTKAQGKGCHDAECETDNTSSKLFAGYTADYRLAWNDGGSGGAYDVSTYRPSIGGDYELVGSVALKGYSAPDKPVIILNSCTWTDVAMEATYYELIYKDRGTGAKMDGSVWRPVCPDGYNSVSDFAQSGYSWPGSLYADLKIRPCIVEQCLTQCEAEWVWDDRGTGGDQDVAFFRITDGVDKYGSNVGHSGGFFRATSHYTSPPKTYLLKCIKEECVQDLSGFL